jgi:NAD(P)-dependent dehydrogenase (short-subunit alcohol dehydrogenase family)
MRVVVTGVSSGIGLSIAKSLNEHEFWGISRRSPPREVSVRFTSCDVTNWAEVSRAATEVAASWNDLGGLVHCAGIQGAVGPAMELEPDEWTRTVNANIEGAYFVVKAFFGRLAFAPQGRGKIILFSGGGASKPRPNFSAYACAKTALVRLTETLAAEWADLPIDINIVASGAINTAMTEEVISLGPELAGRAEFERAERQLLSGGDSVDKLHRMIRFLLSPQSDGLSGKFLSAQWDPIENLCELKSQIQRTDAFTLRRVVS